MTNFEIYKDEILEILQKTGGLFAVRSEDGAVRSCLETACSACMFNNERVICMAARKKWLEKDGKLLSKYRALKKDTPVHVWNDNPECAIDAHFCDILEDKDLVRVYAQGKTSFTTDGLLECYSHMEIAKREEE